MSHVVRFVALVHEQAATGGTVLAGALPVLHRVTLRGSDGTPTKRYSCCTRPQSLLVMHPCPCASASRDGLTHGHVKMRWILANCLRGRSLSSVSGAAATSVLVRDSSRANVCPAWSPRPLYSSAQHDLAQASRPRGRPDKLDQCRHSRTGIQRVSPGLSLSQPRALNHSHR